jgi:hypothetical protein
LDAPSSQSSSSLDPSEVAFAVKVIALVSFFDERADWLSACVASLAKCVDHVVAVDGAYRLFPQAAGHSGDIQAGAIIGTAQALGLGVTYMAPSGPWMRNEVEKRNHALELTLAECEPDVDWILVIDADSLVTQVPSDFKAVLEDTKENVGSYYLTEDFEGGTGKYPARYLYRAHPSLHIRYAHFDYRREQNGQEVCLWENGGLPCCPTDLVVEHRRDKRNEQRNKRDSQYYLLRDAHKIEVFAPLASP